MVLPQHEGRDCVEHHGGCFSLLLTFQPAHFFEKKDRDTFAFLFEPKKATEPLRAGESTLKRARIQSYPSYKAFSCWASEVVLDGRAGHFLASEQAAY